MSEIAWLGTGLLGSGFVEALLDKGERVRVWNRTVDKTRPLGERGAVVAASVADAVRGAARVHLCLSDDAAVESVLEALLPTLEPAAPIFDHTTVSPAGARARQARLAERGVSFLSCPVFMSPAAARAGKGWILLSAAPELRERWTSVLAAMTGEVLPYGDDAARAAAMKLFGNAMIISMTAGLADVLTMAHAQNIAPTEAMGLFAKFPIGGITSGRGKKMADGDYTRSFDLSMARKDVALMLDASGGEALALLPALLARIDALVARGHGQADVGVLAIDAVAPRT